MNPLTVIEKPVFHHPCNGLIRGAHTCDNVIDNAVGLYGGEVAVFFSDAELVAREKAGKPDLPGTQRIIDLNELLHFLWKGGRIAELHYTPASEDAKLVFVGLKKREFRGEPILIIEARTEIRSLLEQLLAPLSNKELPLLFKGQWRSDWRRSWPRHYYLKRNKVMFVW